MKQDKSEANHHLTFLGASWDAWKASRERTQGFARRQQERLQDLVSYARAHSGYLADRYREVPEPCTDIRQLPVVTKAEMMRHFDAWVTDPAVTQQGVTAFIADPSLVGHDYLGRYVVCTTSGSTGIPAILVHDHGALVVYNVLGYIRSLPVFVSTVRNLGALIRGKGRLASVFVTGGHYLGNTMLPHGGASPTSATCGRRPSLHLSQIGSRSKAKFPCPPDDFHHPLVGWQATLWVLVKA